MSYPLQTVLLGLVLGVLSEESRKDAHFYLRQQVDCTRQMALGDKKVSYCILEVPAGVRLVESYLKPTHNAYDAFALSLYQ